MELPGEKLVARLWETVADRAIGSLFKPWQIRREGKALTEVKREEVLVIAQAERDALEIRSGNARLLSDGTVAHLTKAGARQVIRDAEEPEGDLRSFAQLASRAVVADAIRKEVNVTKALMHAESELADDADEPPATRVEEDWLFRWRDSAAAISSDELQRLWGRVLAGEVKSPGSFSLRTVEFLRNISQPEAESIERLSTLLVGDFIYREDSALSLAGVDFKFLLSMQDLGLISGVEALGLELTIGSAEQTGFKQVFVTRDRALVITHPEKRELKLPVYGVSAIGLEVMRLGTQPSNADYLTQMAKKLCDQGFTALLGKYRRVDPTQIQYFEAVPVCAPPPPVGV
jgi:hypothetical protein